MSTATVTLSSRQPALVTLAAALLLAPGCRSTTDPGCASQAITATVTSSNSLAAGTTSSSAITVSRSGGSLPSALGVQAITIQQADVQFMGTGTGTVALALAVNGYLATLGTLSIAHGAVAELTPATYQVAAYSRSAAQTLLDALPEAQRVTLNLQNLDSLSAAQIHEAVSAAIRSASFNVAVLMYTTDNLLGGVSVERITFIVGC